MATRVRKPLKRKDAVAPSTASRKKHAEPQKDIAKSYNQHKKFEGKQYTDTPG
jgi:hypothetical protein